MAEPSRHVPSASPRGRSTATQSTRDLLREALPMLILIGLAVLSVTIVGLFTLIDQIG